MEKDYFVHESSYVDEGCTVGAGTKIWHFSHVMKGCTIGENCNIGQNVVISPGVTLGSGVKCIYQCHQPPGVHRAQERVPQDHGQEGCQHRRQRHHRLRPRHRQIRIRGRRQCGHEKCARLRHGLRQSCQNSGLCVPVRRKTELFRRKGSLPRLWKAI